VYEDLCAWKVQVTMINIAAIITHNFFCHIKLTLLSV